MENIKENDSPQNIHAIETADVNLSAALITKGFTCIGINTSNPNQSVMSFVETPELKEAIRSYWAGNLEGDLREVANIKRELVTKIKQGDSSGLSGKTPN